MRRDGVGDERFNGNEVEMRGGIVLLRNPVLMTKMNPTVAKINIKWYLCTQLILLPLTLPSASAQLSEYLPQWLDLRSSLLVPLIEGQAKPMS